MQNVCKSIKLLIKAFYLMLFVVSVSICLSAQDVTATYSQPSLQEHLQISSSEQSVSYRFWVDQTTFLAMTVSSLEKHLSIRMVGPDGAIFSFGQPIPDQFQCYVNPDPQLVPDAPGANYHMDLTNPVIGQWTLQIQAPTIISSPVTLPLRITFNNQVGPVLFGGGDSPVGKPVSFGLAVMDGTTKVTSLQVDAVLYRLDDTSVVPVSIAFEDDGQGADYSSGDGIYSGIITPSQPGNYMLKVEVSGDASTGHFQRSIASGFKVCPKAATITGTFQERVVVGGPK